MQLYQTHQATEGDSEFIWNLSKATMRDYVQAIWGWDEQWQISRFQSSFQPETWKLVSINGLPVGAYETRLQESALFLARLYILPEFQRRGIGSAIVLNLIAEAHAANVPLTLDVLKSNSDAKRLYERLGLNVVDEAPERYYMSTAVTYEGNR